MLPHILTGQHDLYLRKVMADSEEIRKCIKKHIEKRIDVFFVSLCGYVCGVELLRFVSFLLAQEAAYLEKL